jgi:hypothetical protein
MGLRDRRSGPPAGTPGSSAERTEAMIEEAAAELTAEELREFLEADLLGVPADPEFKERLRRRLWELLRQRRTSDAGGSDGEDAS